MISSHPKNHIQNFNFKAIAFDLDDTLIDTSNLLAPEAAKQAFNLLIQDGLEISLEECEIQRAKYIKKMSHKEFFSFISKKNSKPISNTYLYLWHHQRHARRPPL